MSPGASADASIRADDHPSGVANYVRRRPEETLLYRVLQNHWRPFLADLEAGSDGAPLPRFIVEEIEAYLRCGILAHGFLRVRCEECGESRVVGLSCKRRGFCPSCIGRRMSDTAAHLVDRVLPHVPTRQWVLTVPHALRFRLAFDPALTGRVLGHFVRAVSSWLRRRARRLGIKGTLKTGAVTVIQRFDSALGLNVHYHSTFLDGVYSRQRTKGPGASGWELVFHPTPAPRDEEVAAVVTRVCRAVLKDEDPAADPAGRDGPTLSSIAQASIGLRVATGARRGLAVRRRGRGPPPQRRGGYEIKGRRCAQIEGFNLHANTRIAANDRSGLENLCRYMGRPPLSDDRLAETSDGNLSLKLKRPWSDGTTHLILSPTELIEKLLPLVPRPRAHLTATTECWPRRRDGGPWSYRWPSRPTHLSRFHRRNTTIPCLQPSPAGVDGRRGLSS